MNNNLAQNKIYHIKVDSLETKQSSGKAPTSINNVKNNTGPVTKKNNSLCGLLAHYNSDSETEEIDKLDVKVDSFLQEINEITPSEPATPTSTTTNIAWQECFDASTGFPYYWNTETNEVTWEIPADYAKWLENQSSTNVTEIITPKLPETTHVKPPESPAPKTPLEITKDEPIKMEEEKKTAKPEVKVVAKKKRVQTRPARSRRVSSDSDEGKIELISSYCEDSSESESEADPKVEKKVEEKEEIKIPSPLPVLGPHIEDMPQEIRETTVLKEEKREIIETVKEDVDETVILARLRTQAKVLQELDGELPESVDKFLSNIDKEKTPLSLVAGYGDESDEEIEEPEEIMPKTLFPIPEPTLVSENTTSESTLFPITIPIDINQFAAKEEEKPVIQPKPEETSPETKIVKRKKRIAFDVLPAIAEKKSKSSDDVRRGFGFKMEPDSNSNDEKPFISFQKGGVAFVKSDETVLPIVESDENVKNFNETKDIVREKVEFLSEGKNEVSAVQIISIQLNTLEAAFKAGGLSEKYLSRWLRETNSELAKLEKDAAPEGWKCRWDRSHKRYFYHNEQSGETQWEYPAPIEAPPAAVCQDIIGGGEEMDICTTPPPGEEAELNAQAEEPPKGVTKEVRVPSPPPPPIITVTTGVDHTEDYNPPPLPPPPTIDPVPPPPPPPCISQDQPLPPGVDPLDSAHFANEKPSAQAEGKRDSFGSELDSFYSDIAKLETTTSINSEIIETVPVVSKPENGGTTEVVKKKKKTKSKIGQGSTMKKKNVSTLVEKWKKVQNDFL